jgi:hypothetical protein
MDIIKIDKNIPMPEKWSAKKKYPISELEVGDSFEVDALFENNVRTSSYRFPDKKFTVLKQKNGTYRCWRIK